MAEADQAGEVAGAEAVVVAEVVAVEVEALRGPKSNIQKSLFFEVLTANQHKQSQFSHSSYQREYRSWVGQFGLLRACSQMETVCYQPHSSAMRAVVFPVDIYL